jgi:hypothetical protein
VLGEVGALPDVFSELEVNFFLLRRLLGVRSKEGEKQSKVRAAAHSPGSLYGRGEGGRIPPQRRHKWILSPQR